MRNEDDSFFKTPSSFVPFSSTLLFFYFFFSSSWEMPPSKPGPWTGRLHQAIYPQRGKHFPHLSVLAGSEFHSISWRRSELLLRREALPTS